MASANFVSSDKNSWYFGDYDRKKTQDKLLGQIHGTFLVRDSKTCPGDYVLSVSENSKVSHYIINHLPHKLKIGEQEFGNLTELLEFYKVHYLDTTTLIQPAPKDNEDRVDGVGAEKPVPAVGLGNGMPVSQAKMGENYPMHPSTTKLEVKALFDFKGNDTEDLPFKKGEILEIVAKPEDNWWTAKNRAGKTGLIPVPYIERLNVRLSQPNIGSHKHIQDNPNRISLPTDIGNHPIYAQVKMQRVPSAYDPSALALDVGDVVRVTKMNPNGQWEGTIKGRTGMFPFTHVQVLENYNPE